MKIFLDFDDVVFNTKQFIADRDQIFLDNNIAPEIFNKYPNDYSSKRKRGELARYSEKEHLESLKNELNIDFQKLKKELLEINKNAKKYVFKEFYDFAEKIGKENLFLLSYGDIEYQTKKIKNSGVEEYFNKVIIIDGLKSEAIAERFKKDDGEVAITEKVYFIDDRVAHLEDVKKEFPEIKTLLMASENGRHHKEEIEDKIRIDKYCDGVIRDFTEMEKLLKQDDELKTRVLL